MTSEQNINKLVGYIEQDFEALFKGIKAYEPKLNELLDLIRDAQPFFSTHIMGFTVLMRKYCFNNFNKEGIDLHSKRGELIEKVFYSKIKPDYRRKTAFSPFSENDLPDSGMLIYFLYIAIFERLLRSSKNIKDIFQELLNEWKTAMNRLKMNISVIFCLPIHAEIGDYKITENINVYSRILHIKVDETIDDPMNVVRFGTYIAYYPNYQAKLRNPNTKIDIYPIRSYLVYNTEIPFELIETDWDIWGKERTKIREVEEYVRRKLREIINTLYLYGFEFNFGDYAIKFPWWFEFDIEELDKYIPRVIYHSGITNQNIFDISNLYSEVIKSRIFYDKKFEIITYRYHQIHNRDYLPDIILDSCIILEWLFTRNMMQELKFRLSLNGALFLSSDWKEFKKNQKFLANLYQIRSSIIHGSDYEKEISKLIDKGLFNNQNSIKSDIRRILNRVIKKLVSLKLKHPDILKRLGEKNFFFESSDIIKK